MKFFVTLLAFLLAALPVSAQDWPTKPVKIVVPFGAGSTARRGRPPDRGPFAEKARSAVRDRQQAGASGNLGTDAVAKAAPDGATIGVSIGGPLAINTLLFSKLPYDPKTDIAPITQLVTQPSALAVVNSQVMVNSAAELVALLKREPANTTSGRSETARCRTLAMGAIALASGTQMVHIPYPTSPAAMNRNHQRRRA